MKTTPKPRLTVELIPPSAWGKNVRAVVSADTWEALRWHFGAVLYRPRFMSIDFERDCFRTELKCAFCLTTAKTLELHEEWHFDDKRLVQRLKGLKPICKKCHLVTHLGHANATGRTEEALSHLASVNSWTRHQAEKHSDEAFANWRRRSGNAYSLDVSYLHQHIPVSKIHLDWLDNPRTWIGNRLDAIIWADKALKSDAIIIDTETTGLLDYNANVEVIELAAVNMRGKLLYQSLYRPLHSIPRKAINIHGIKNRDVKASPPFASETERLSKLLSGKTIITFNAKFDREMLAKTCTMHRVEMPSCRWECAMQAFRTFSGAGQYLPLPGNSHRAIADAKATLKLLRHMARAAF